MLIVAPERCRNRKGMSSVEKCLDLDSQLVHPLATPIRELIFRPNYCQTRLYDGNWRSFKENSWDNLPKSIHGPLKARKQQIKTILRVKDSIQTPERFEKYRETVKAMEYNRYTKHPRSLVNGNKLPKFYATTMACRSQRSKRVSELCKNPACRVCRIIQSHFGVEHALSIGIQLSSGSEDFSENVIPVAKRTKNTERAVIVCRTIAGSLVSINNEECNEYNLIGNQKPNYNSGNVIVCHPSAVLPCFVIVFN